MRCVRYLRASLASSILLARSGPRYCIFRLGVTYNQYSPDQTVFELILPWETIKIRKTRFKSKQGVYWMILPPVHFVFCSHTFLNDNDGKREIHFQPLHYS